MKLRVENQNLKKELEQEKEQSIKLNTAIDGLEEKIPLSKSKASQL